MNDGDVRVVPAGDAALVIELASRDDQIEAAVNARAVAIGRALEQAHVTGVRDVVPAYRSVSVFFDPLRTNQDELRAHIAKACDSRATQEGRPASPPIEIPVCYGGRFGPDLDAVAESVGLSCEEVIDVHVSVLYRVFMIGFFPGFAYLGIVDPRIAVPRHKTPRVRVPAGSVGIAGQQTGIYPSETPGGWQLIGKTPIKPIDMSRDSPFLFAAGDSVKFVAIGRDEYARLDEAR